MGDNISDLIKLINENFSNSNIRWRGDWEDLFDRNCPNWRTLVSDPENWPLIEASIYSGLSYSALCDALLDAAGARLAVHWSNSDEEVRRERARQWLDHEKLTSKIWNELDDETKGYIISSLFRYHPGEPFETLREYYHDLHFLSARHGRYTYLYGQILNQILIGYITSPEVQQLRSIIKSAGDQRSSGIVDDLIKERRDALEKFIPMPQSQRIFYTPTRDERELIARVMDKFISNGYMPSALPQIHLSFETPPIFVAYPELEEEEEEEEIDRDIFEQENARIPRDRQRERPETVSIEEALGCYVPDAQIVLYGRGLEWYSRRYHFDWQLLQGIVLIHEIGHWATHLLPRAGVPSWPTELYKLTLKEVHEGWAQLITWWVVDEIGGEIKQVFEDLSRRQPYLYHAYEEFKGVPIGSVIGSLEWLRQLHQPARIDDWKRLIR